MHTTTGVNITNCPECDYEWGKGTREEKLNEEIAKWRSKWKFILKSIISVFRYCKPPPEQCICQEQVKKKELMADGDLCWVWLKKGFYTGREYNEFI